MNTVPANFLLAADDHDKEVQNAGRAALGRRLYEGSRRRRLLYEAIIDERRRHPELVEASDTVDLSGLFDDWTEPVYIDLYHLSEAGNAAVAEAMLPAVAQVASASRPRAGAAVGGR